MYSNWRIISNRRKKILHSFLNKYETLIISRKKVLVSILISINVINSLYAWRCRGCTRKKVFPSFLNKYETLLCGLRWSLYPLIWLYWKDKQLTVWITTSALRAYVFFYMCLNYFFAIHFGNEFVKNFFWSIYPILNKVFVESFFNFYVQ